MSGSKENVRAYEEDECQGLLQDLEVIHANQTETAVLALETCVIFIYIYIYINIYIVYPSNALNGLNYTIIEKQNTLLKHC